MITLLLVGLAQATTDAKVCVEAITAYTDANPDSDFFGTVMPRPLRGMKVEIKENFGAGNTFTARTAATGSDKGCAAFSSVNNAPGATYKVRILADQVVNSASVTIHDSDSGIVWIEVLTTSASFLQFTPPGGAATLSYQVGPEPAWSVAAVTGWALHRTTGGLGATIDTGIFVPDASGVLQDLPAGCGSNGCVIGDKIYISEDRSNKEHLIAYALGLTFFEAMGGANFTTTQSEPDHNGASPLHLAGPQDLTGALYAGYGHLYDAVVFNKIAEADCAVTAWQNTNWDLMGAPCYTEVESVDGQAISCAVGRAPLAPAWGQVDYYEAMGDYTRPAGFVTAPIDVVRFWWQAIQDHGMTFADITAAYDGTTPSSWTPTPAPDFETELGTFMSSAEYQALVNRHMY